MIPAVGMLVCLVIVVVRASLKQHAHTSAPLTMNNPVQSLYMYNQVSVRPHGEADPLCKVL